MHRMKPVNSMKKFKRVVIVYFVHPVEIYDRKIAPTIQSFKLPNAKLKILGQDFYKELRWSRALSVDENSKLSQCFDLQLSRLTRSHPRSTLAHIQRVGICPILICNNESSNSSLP